MTDEITRAIERRTESLRLERLLRKKGLWTMALELKGLKANMLKLQARVSRLNTIAMEADERGALLESHLGDVGKQLGTHVDDIEFAGNVLGNSGGSLAEELGPPAEPFREPGVGDGTTKPE